MTSESVTRALEYLRQAIVQGWLTPGEKVNQNSIAELTGVSRIPVREALGILAAEGSLTYLPNRGYAIPKLRVDELRQIYRIRTLVEDDLVSQIVDPDPRKLRDLTKLNEKMIVAARNGELPEFVWLNRQFHFNVLGLSGQDLMLAEISRLWAMSDAYRAIYLYEPRTAEAATHDHIDIIDALSTGQLERCAVLLHEHRTRAQDHVTRLLSARERGHPDGPGHSPETRPVTR